MLHPLVPKVGKYRGRKNGKGKKDKENKKDEKGGRDHWGNKVNPEINKNSGFKTSVYYYIIYKY